MGKKYLILFVGLFFRYLYGSAQQDPQFSIYMLNRPIFNPAAVGTGKGMEITSAVRNQWVGIDGAPRTGTLTFGTPSLRLRGGIGLALFSDAIGQFRTTSFKGQYGYRFELGDPDKGSFLQAGIGIGLLQKSIVTGAWRTGSGDNGSSDPVLNTLSGSATLFDLDIGAFYQLPKDKGHLSVALTHLTEPSLEPLGEPGRIRSRVARHFYVTGGYKLALGAKARLEPNGLLKVAGPQFQLDVNLNLYVDPVMFGIGRRGIGKTDCFLGMMGLQITERLFAAYSYDLTVSRLGPYTSGSHEVLVCYRIREVSKLRPPDYGVRDKKTDTSRQGTPKKNK